MYSASDAIGAGIIDENFLTRIGIRSTIECSPFLRVVGEATRMAEATPLLIQSALDVVVVSLLYPTAEDIDLAAAVLQRTRRVKALLLTTLDHPPCLVRAFLAGVRGCLIYGRFNSADLVQAVIQVTTGGVVIASSVGRVLIDHLTRQATGVGRENYLTTHTLSRRESEVLTLIAAGRSNGDIAKTLGIAPKTVKNHINSIYSKSVFATRYEAISAVIRPSPWAREGPPISSLDIDPGQAWQPTEPPAGT